MTTSCFNLHIFFLFLIFTATTVKAQENFSVLAEPEFSLNINTPNRWSFNFQAGNRDLIYAEEENIFKVRHIELTHFTSYETGFYSKISLGIRYRFREMFDNSNVDEKRLIQQYGHSRRYNALTIAHRARLEERFRENTTFRTRYEFSVEVPLSGLRLDQKEFFIVTDTEALWSLGKHEKPSLEQRLGVSLGNQVGKNTKISLGLQYRYNDYTTTPSSELFIQTGVSFSL
ncbi:DUF2490 domain-containing protein [Zunongwangia sp. F363]|uniref:DUF2490 domain-containing protein n=1 Tax=Autumnicola tepida TaxID=3075595 RepID=A0ABU3C4K3_9FLAO|nr:DUF2490 domain-containing protein [Zunongwangia sp. F363]MDT0641218.1 DUF2490 domain-containing protein [Zunongwangia sp. F363]